MRLLCSWIIENEVRAVEWAIMINVSRVAGREPRWLLSLGAVLVSSWLCR